MKGLRRLATHINASIAPLVMSDVGRRYRPSRPWAIRHASLTFPAGSITALVGPNGAGKSTLLRTFLGFERADEGSVAVFGIDPSRDRRRAVELTGFVPQRPGLHRGLTIGDHIWLARAARPDLDVGSVTELLTDAQLDAHRKVGELSSGEQAKVALFIAFGTMAPILLLDEPLASLDPLARREFLGVLLDEVKARGTTVVLSSHNIGDIEHACDRLVVIAGGAIRFEDRVDVGLARFGIATTINPRDAIGVFALATGDRVALVPAPLAHRPASLEELVLGHLAAESRGTSVGTQ